MENTSTPNDEILSPPFSIVGIGASAGGVEAVTALFRHTTSAQTAYVVVQHLDPEHSSLLPEIFARSTKMKVLTARHGMIVEPGHVYVIAPNAELGLLKGALQVFGRPKERAPRPTIDLFFRALAEDHGSRAIGVILSGTGTDGTFGLMSIKASGGVTFVQDPASAKFDAMPRHALSSGCADFSLSPEAIATELAHLEEHPGGTIDHRNVLIGVTSFFRDKTPFEALKHTFRSAKAGDSIRVWVPACSTGEEAFSIAIVLFEVLGERARDLHLQIFGTDVNAAAINQARLGAYPENIALDVSRERLERYFVKADGGYEVSRAIRDVVVFSTQNVATDPPISRLDLISCRNLLIYFQRPLQKKVLEKLHFALNPSGHLLLGSSETVGDAQGLFSLVDKENKIYVKKPLALDPRRTKFRRPLPIALPVIGDGIQKLRAANEALQCTNQELETAREELRSSNEELIAINNELEGRMNELSHVNEDLHNMLVGIDNAVMIIGKDLRIRRFTRAAERMLSLGDRDVGKSAGSLKFFAGEKNMDAAVSDAIRAHASSSETIQGSDGRWYSLRVLPYETGDETTRGAMIVLGDIDAKKRHADVTRDAAEYAKVYLGVIPRPLLLLDEKLRIVWANALFYAAFELVAEETIGTSLGDLGTGEWTNVAAIVTSGPTFKDVLLRHVSAKTGEKIVHVNGCLLPASASRAALLLLSMEAQDEERTAAS